MNQEKIGKFIAKIRKEKNITQQVLANKIGVTDRAISNWENGRRMPDLSLIKPLCDELGITINDLLSGEKIDQQDYQEKLEENILNTINYSEKKLKNIKKTFKIILFIILIIILLFITMFTIDINRMKNQKSVIFSTWGFKYIPPINLDDENINLAIEKYITNKADKNKKYDSEKTFVAMRTYLLEEKEKNKLYYVYAWVLEESYYLSKNEIIENSASSIPYKFVVEKINDKFEVTDSRIPRDGSYYAIDMKNIFPRSVRNDMDKVQYDGTIDKLQLDITEQLKLYYHQ